MNKKVFAVALIIVSIATMFTACKKYDLEKINGKEYAVYKDDSDNTVVNDENKVAVLVTDEDGEVITYENGEEQTRWVQNHNDTVLKDKVLGTNYTMGIPSGWEGSEFGKVIKKKTDKKCYIEFKQLKKLGLEDTLKGLLEVQDENDMLIGNALKDEAKMQEIIKQNPSQEDAIKGLIGSTYTLDKKTVSITKDAIPCEVRIHKIVNASGKIILYFLLLTS